MRIKLMFGVMAAAATTAALAQVTPHDGHSGKTSLTQTMERLSREMEAEQAAPNETIANMVVPAEDPPETAPPAPRDDDTPPVTHDGDAGDPPPQG